MSKPEGIEFNPIGTVDVTFDGTTYHLGRPKFRQFKHFTQALTDATAEDRKELFRLRDELDAAKAKYEDEDTPEAQAEVTRLTEEVNTFTGKPFYENTIPVLAEMFSQLGDPLPEDPDDWPAWFAVDAMMPRKITDHWRNDPKASGPTPPT